MKTLTIEIDSYLIGVLESSLRADCEWLAHLPDRHGRNTDWAEIERYAGHIVKMSRVVQQYHNAQPKKGRKR